MIFDLDKIFVDISSEVGFEGFCGVIEKSDS